MNTHIQKGLSWLLSFLLVFSSLQLNIFAEDTNEPVEIESVTEVITTEAMQEVVDDVTITAVQQESGDVIVTVSSSDVATYLANITDIVVMTDEFFDRIYSEDWHFDENTITISASLLKFNDVETGGTSTVEIRADNYEKKQASFTMVKGVLPAPEITMTQDSETGDVILSATDDYINNIEMLIANGVKSNGEKVTYYLYTRDPYTLENVTIENDQLIIPYSFVMEAGLLVGDYTVETRVYYYKNTYENLQITVSEKGSLVEAGHSITYVLNGGTNNVSNPDSYKEEDGTITFADPTRKGYTFGGWYTDSAYTNSISSINCSKKEDVTVYAKWTPITYKIKYNANGGTGSMSSTTATYGSSKTLRTNTFTRTGYKFAGWNKAKDGSSTSYADASKVKNLKSTQDASITLYAQWEPIVYIIKYEANGASGTMENQEIKYDESTLLATNTYTKKGYTLTSWNTKSDGSGTSYAVDAEVLNLKNTEGASVILYAQWKANTYTVKYNANGGTGTMSSKKVTYGKTYTLTANTFTRTGYTFVGWNTKSDGSGTSYDDAVSVKNLTSTDGKTVTLYAQWKANTYTVKYNANEGTGTMSSNKMTYGKTYTLTANAFTRTGYTFVGWNTSADGSGKSYDDEMSVKNLTSANGKTITLYAQWSVNSYKVKYNNNGGSGSMSSKTVTYGKTYTLTTNTFTRTGYTFTGWNTKADGSGTAYADGASVKNLKSTDGASITMYAQWSVNSYKIKYNANGGTGTMSSNTVKYNETVTLAANTFAFKGYHFVGWNTKADGTGTVYTDEQEVTKLKSADGSSITLYAQWEINTYKVKYNANGGSGTMSSKTMTYGKSYTLASNAYTREGYIFTGWNTKADGSGISYADEASVKNLTSTNGRSVYLYAQWKPITYKIKYSANGGSGSMSSTSATYDTEVALRKNAFTNGDLTFIGWNTKADGSGTDYIDQESVSNLVSEDGTSIKLYAQWKGYSDNELSILDNLDEKIYIKDLKGNTSQDRYLELPESYKNLVKTSLKLLSVEFTDEETQLINNTIDEAQEYIADFVRTDLSGYIEYHGLGGAIETEVLMLGSFGSKIRNHITVLVYNLAKQLYVEIAITGNGANNMKVVSDGRLDKVTPVTGQAEGFNSVGTDASGNIYVSSYNTELINGITEFRLVDSQGISYSTSDSYNISDLENIASLSVDFIKSSQLIVNTEVKVYVTSNGVESYAGTVTLTEGIIPLKMTSLSTETEGLVSFTLDKELSGFGLYICEEKGDELIYIGGYSSSYPESWQVKLNNGVYSIDLSYFSHVVNSEYYLVVNSYNYSDAFSNEKITITNGKAKAPEMMMEQLENGDVVITTDSAYFEEYSSSIGYYYETDTSTESGYFLDYEYSIEGNTLTISFDVIMSKKIAKNSNITLSFYTTEHYAATSVTGYLEQGCLTPNVTVEQNEEGDIIISTTDPNYFQNVTDFRIGWHYIELPEDKTVTTITISYEQVLNYSFAEGKSYSVQIDAEGYESYWKRLSITKGVLPDSYFVEQDEQGNLIITTTTEHIEKITRISFNGKDLDSTQFVIEGNVITIPWSVLCRLNPKQYESSITIFAEGYESNSRLLVLTTYFEYPSLDARQEENGDITIETTSDFISNMYELRIADKVLSSTEYNINGNVITIPFSTIENNRIYSKAITMNFKADGYLDSWTYVNLDERYVPEITVTQSTDSGDIVIYSADTGFIEDIKYVRIISDSYTGNVYGEIDELDRGLYVVPSHYYEGYLEVGEVQISICYGVDYNYSTTLMITKGIQICNDVVITQDNEGNVYITAEEDFISNVTEISFDDYFLVYDIDPESSDFEIVDNQIVIDYSRVYGYNLKQGQETEIVIYSSGYKNVLINYEVSVGVDTIRLLSISQNDNGSLVFEIAKRVSELSMPVEMDIDGVNVTDYLANTITANTYVRYVLYKESIWALGLKNNQNLMITLRAEGCQDKEFQYLLERGITTADFDVNQMENGDLHINLEGYADYYNKCYPISINNNTLSKGTDCTYENNHIVIPYSYLIENELYAGSEIEIAMSAKGYTDYQKSFTLAMGFRKADVTVSQDTVGNVVLTSTSDYFTNMSAISLNGQVLEEDEYEISDNKLVIPFTRFVEGQIYVGTTLSFEVSSYGYTVYSGSYKLTKGYDNPSITMTQDEAGNVVLSTSQDIFSNLLAVEFDGINLELKDVELSENTLTIPYRFVVENNREAGDTVGVSINAYGYSLYEDELVLTKGIIDAELTMAQDNDGNLIVIADEKYISSLGAVKLGNKALTHDEYSINENQIVIPFEVIENLKYYAGTTAVVTCTAFGYKPASTSATLVKGAVFESSIVNNLREKIYIKDLKGQVDENRYLELPETYVNLVISCLQALSVPFTEEENELINQTIDEAQEYVADYAKNNLSGYIAYNGLGYAIETEILMLGSIGSEIRNHITLMIFNLAKQLYVEIAITGRGTENMTVIADGRLEQKTPNVGAESFDFTVKDDTDGMIYVSSYNTSLISNVTAFHVVGNNVDEYLNYSYYIKKSTNVVALSYADACYSSHIPSGTYSLNFVSDGVEYEIGDHAVTTSVQPLDVDVSVDSDSNIIVDTHISSIDYITVSLTSTENSFYSKSINCYSIDEGKATISRDEFSDFPDGTYSVKIFVSYSYQRVTLSQPITLSNGKPVAPVTTIVQNEDGELVITADEEYVDTVQSVYLVKNKELISVGCTRSRNQIIISYSYLTDEEYIDGMTTTVAIKSSEYSMQFLDITLEQGGVKEVGEISVEQTSNGDIIITSDAEYLSQISSIKLNYYSSLDSDGYEINDNKLTISYDTVLDYRISEGSNQPLYIYANGYKSKEISVYVVKGCVYPIVQVTQNSDGDIIVETENDDFFDDFKVYYNENTVSEDNYVIEGNTLTISRNVPLSGNKGVGEQAFVKIYSRGYTMFNKGFTLVVGPPKAPELSFSQNENMDFVIEGDGEYLNSIKYFYFENDDWDTYYIYPSSFVIQDNQLVVPYDTLSECDITSSTYYISIYANGYLNYNGSEITINMN